MLHLALRRQAVGERGQERERIVRVALVLGQVERHAADEPPLRVALAEITLRPAGVPGDLAPGQRIEVLPPVRQDFRRQVLQAGHRRGLQDGPLEIRHRGRDLGYGYARFRRRRLAEVREIKPGNRARELEGRRQHRVHLGACGVEHPPRRAFPVRFEQRLRRLSVRWLERRFSDEEMPSRRDGQFVHRAATRGRLWCTDRHVMAAIGRCQGAVDDLAGLRRSGRLRLRATALLGGII